MDPRTSRASRRTSFNKAVAISGLLKFRRPRLPAYRICGDGGLARRNHHVTFKGCQLR
jgi:hypothetical protein